MKSLLIGAMVVAGLTWGVALPLLAGTLDDKTSTTSSTTEQPTREYGQEGCFEDEVEVEVNGERYCAALDDLRKLGE